MTAAATTSPMTGAPLIEGTDLGKTYRMGPRDLTVLHGVSLRVHAGELVAIVGPSGSGKSTLMALIGCLDRPSSGTLKIGGQDVSRVGERRRAQIRNREIGFVFQSFHLIPRMSALDNVAVPLLYGRIAGAHARAGAALAAVGLADRMTHTPQEMSGGERQRVAIARAIVCRPKLLLADEPTGNLDTRTGEEILGVLESLVAQGVGMVMVTHDMDVAARAHRTIHLRDGVIEREERRA